MQAIEDSTVSTMADTENSPPVKIRVGQHLSHKDCVGLYGVLIGGGDGFAVIRPDDKSRGRIDVWGWSEVTTIDDEAVCHKLHSPYATIDDLDNLNALAAIINELLSFDISAGRPGRNELASALCRELRHELELLCVELWPPRLLRHRVSA